MIFSLVWLQNLIYLCFGNTFLYYVWTKITLNMQYFFFKPQKKNSFTFFSFCAVGRQHHLAAGNCFFVCLSLFLVPDHHPHPLVWEVWRALLVIWREKGRGKIGACNWKAMKLNFLSKSPNVCPSVCLRHWMQLFSRPLIGPDMIWSVPRPLISQPPPHYAFKGNLTRLAWFQTYFNWLFHKTPGLRQWIWSSKSWMREMHVFSP